MKKTLLLTSIVTLVMSASVFAAGSCNGNICINGTSQKYNNFSGGIFVNGKYVETDLTDLRTKINEFIQKCREEAIENSKWLTTEATTRPVERPSQATTKPSTEATTKAHVAEKPTEATTKAQVAEKPTKATTRAHVTEKPTEVTTKEKPTQTTTRKTTVERPTEATTAAVNVDQSMAQQVLNLVNNERANNGLPTLKLNNKLSAVAQKKAEDMKSKNYFSHTSPTYGSPFNMMKNAGITYKTAGENIAYGQKTAQAVFNDWMNSPGHRQNILNKNYKEMGLGVTSGGRMYWSQMFIG